MTGMKLAGFFSTLPWASLSLSNCTAPALLRPFVLPLAAARGPIKRKAAFDSRRKAAGSRLQSRKLDSERAAAAAGALHIGVVKFEPRALERLDVINFDAVQIHLAHLVHQDLEAGEFVHIVRIVHLVLEGHVIGEARTAAADHGHTQSVWRRRLLRHDFLHFNACYRRNSQHDMCDSLSHPDSGVNSDSDPPHPLYQKRQSLMNQLCLCSPGRIHSPGTALRASTSAC